MIWPRTFISRVKVATNIEWHETGCSTMNYADTTRVNAQ